MCDKNNVNNAVTKNIEQLLINLALQYYKKSLEHTLNRPTLAQIRLIEDIIERLGEIMRPDPVLPTGPRIIFTTDKKSNETVAQKVVQDWAVPVSVGPIQENTVKETVMK